MEKLVFDEMLELVDALNNIEDAVLPLIIWDVFRGKVDANTIALAKWGLEHRPGNYDRFEIVRAVAGWNPERLPELEEEVLMISLVDLYREEVLGDSDGF